MKLTTFLVLAFTVFVQVILAENYLCEFKDYLAAGDCMTNNAAYINKISTNKTELLDNLIIMELKNDCSNSIRDEFTAVCHDVTWCNCFWSPNK
ncbi:hypothetical protein INT43_005808 [Umbelopsis isabellina]|uniref:Uncharacterized protein n=1 Tax=Mortierella isabellina TaxID=91625 RepID=A0A8H7PJ66_MORIS|nr:hypothetical protein INT43_005808 [Umbelopsis isabellina]